MSAGKRNNQFYCSYLDYTLMDYLSQLLTLSGIILLACASPGPDFVAVTSHALSNRRSGVFVGLGIASVSGPTIAFATGCVVAGGLTMRVAITTTRHLRKVKETRKALTEAMQRLERHIASQPPFVPSHDLPTPHIQSTRTPTRYSRRNRV